MIFRLCIRIKKQPKKIWCSVASSCMSLFHQNTFISKPHKIQLVCLMIWVESVSSDQSNDHHNVIRNNHLLKTQRELIDYCSSPSPSGVIKGNQYEWRKLELIPYGYNSNIWPTPNEQVQLIWSVGKQLSVSEKAC